MMEFTMSRVAVCVCGAILLMTVIGVIGGIHDVEEYGMDDELTGRISRMLDEFQASGVDTMVLEGCSILPSGCTLRVGNGVVEVSNGDARHISITSFIGEFSLDSKGVVTIARQNPEIS